MVFELNNNASTHYKSYKYKTRSFYPMINLFITLNVQIIILMRQIFPLLGERS